MKKIIISLALCIIAIACAGNKKSDGQSSVDGAKIYKINCTICHGADGKLGINGSKDISQSILTKEERIELIKNGKNTMLPFKALLSEEEIEAVAEFTFSLK